MIVLSLSQYLSEIYHKISQQYQLSKNRLNYSNDKQKKTKIKNLRKSLFRKKTKKSFTKHFSNKKKKKTISGIWNPEVEQQMVIGEVPQEEHSFAEKENLDVNFWNHTNIPKLEQSNNNHVEEVKYLKKEISDLRNQMSSKHETNSRNDEIVELKKEINFYKQKLIECEKHLFDQQQQHSIDPQIHQKIHCQEETIQNLKTQICNLNLDHQKQTSKLIFEISSLKKSLKQQEEKNLKFIDENKSNDILIKDKNKKLEIKEQQLNQLEHKLKNRENEVLFLQKNLDQIQQEIKFRMKKSNPQSETGNSELNSLAQMNFLLKSEYNNLHNLF